MYEIDVQRDFSAAHHLTSYPGNCARLHGHNWTVQVVVRAAQVDELGIACDFRRLKHELDELLAEFDHQDLGALACFQDCNPTSENLARLIFGRLAAKLNAAGLRVARVRVCETPSSGATYYEED